MQEKEVKFCLRVSLIYSNDLLADILTNAEHFN